MERMAPTNSEHLVVQTIQEAFGDVSDPRVDNTLYYEFFDLLCFALVAVLAGAEGWSDMAQFAELRLDWFKSFLKLRRGPPPRWVFYRVFRAIEPAVFQAALGNWVQLLAKRLDLKFDHLSFDGKAIRGATKKGFETSPLFMLHIWAHEHGLLLGHKTIAGAPNEPEAFLKLLEGLSVKGMLISADANSANKDIMNGIVEKEADFSFPVKGNRPELLAEATKAFAGAKETTEHLESSRGHGREETRKALVAWVDEAMPLIGYPHVKAVMRLERTRKVGGKEEVETATYVSSRKMDAKEWSRYARNHWGIENGLHWMLDVVMGEDDHLMESGPAAENLATLKRFCVMLVRRKPRGKYESFASRLRKAAWSIEYLERLLVTSLSAD